MSKAITAAERKRVYREEWLREYDRNRRFFKVGKGRMLISLDQMLEGLENESAEPSWCSDNGAGVERMIAELDGEIPTAEDHRLRFLIAAAVVAAVVPSALSTFLLIVKNGNNRKESIWALARYHRKNGKQPRKNIIAI